MAAMGAVVGGSGGIIEIQVKDSDEVRAPRQPQTHTHKRTHRGISTHTHTHVKAQACARVRTHPNVTLCVCVCVCAFGGHQVVEVELDELPQDATEITDILRTEAAPLHLWHRFAVRDARSACKGRSLTPRLHMTARVLPPRPHRSV
jgi:hypothetical protein